MNHRLLFAITTFSLPLGSIALAQTQYDEDERRGTVALSPRVDTYEEVEVEGGAPDDAFEISVQGGYTQPFGEVADGRNFNDIAEAGGAAAIELGYRFEPEISLGILAQYHEQFLAGNLGERSDLRGFATTIQGTAHFRPYDTVDPYLTFGTGYRVLWLSTVGDDNDTVTHGFQLARVTFGVDFRVSESVALGPVAGADVNLFLWDEQTGPGAGSTIDDPRPSTFVFAGMAGRFDIGGRRVGRTPEYAPVAVDLGSR